MPIYTKRLLSGSANGISVKVSATGSPGTTIHTAVAGTTDFDEIWLYAVNTDPSDKKLTIQWGGTTNPDHTLEITVQGESGLVLIIPGLLLQNGLLVKAFCDTANVVLMYGFVNRITN